MYLPVVFAAAQNDATDLVSAIPARGGHHLFAVFPLVEPLDLPKVRLNPAILQLLNCLHHQLRTQFEVVSRFVTLEPFKLRLLSGHEQFEHEPALALVAQIVGKLFQTRHLAFV